MAKKICTKPVVAAVGAALIGSLSAISIANAAENPFGATALESGYMQLAGNDKEGKCGGDMGAEGKCGVDKGKEGKCGEGKCGGDKGKEGKCGEGKSSGDKGKEGKCGEGKCGGGK